MSPNLCGLIYMKARKQIQSTKHKKQIKSSPSTCKPQPNPHLQVQSTKPKNNIVLWSTTTIVTVTTMVTTLVCNFRNIEDHNESTILIRI